MVTQTVTFSAASEACAAPLLVSATSRSGRTLILPDSSFTADAELFVINVGQAFRPAAGFLAGSRNAGRKPGGSPKGLPHKNRRSAQRFWSLVVQRCVETHPDAFFGSLLPPGTLRDLCAGKAYH